LGGSGGLGSNSWAVSGALTDTGMPLLANDPHLAAQIPSIWYEVGLHCLPKGPQCPLDVVGFSFAGAPGVVIGHNDRIAWGLTNAGPDVMDLYIEKINPQNPNQYEFLGEWIDMQVITEVVEVAGGEPVELTVRLTHHGPLITEAYGLEDLAQEVGLDFPQPYAIALRWTSLEPNNTFRAIFNFNRAQNWQEFRQAAREFAVPSQNLLYADVDGNIGYQMPGNIPLRSAGHSGMEPVPGWTGEGEWQGYIPFEELPFAFNPPEGYLVTANNAVVGPEYPHSISRVWDYGLRAQRIVEMIEAAPGPISLADMQRMQGDNRDLNAELLVPYLLALPLEEGRLAGARQLLVGWDGQAHMDSAPAALFAAFWKHLVAGTFGDELPDSQAPSGNDRWMQVLRPLLQDPNNAWWDDLDRPGTQARDDILRQALADAVDELGRMLGEDPAGWAWGDLHTIIFRHGVMDSFPLVNGLFNRGPFRTSGGGEIVNATGWDVSGEGYGVGSVPSLRMVVDLGDLRNSVSMHTTGQSGHPYQAHYIDMADPWREIRYQPMLWDRAGIEAAAQAHLRLVP
jgi:penicillin amidase